ncbi:PPC domain-containing protein [Myxococcota bacterium]|nr:PPC domain-containing protein [Myxococcota bacterium]MBU1381475.1 PPC domain-containing protein [Myxococcota bacterium]MBU1497691.1 PPC domain-containing protein [Myxococcota bacterium]
MRKLFLLFITVLSFYGCYNPDLNDNPFVCGGSHGNPECPDGYSCYGGICLDQKPACWTDYFFNTVHGYADQDFEPNNVPSLAYTLQCGDIVNPACPTRYDIPFTSSNLVICGEGDIDIYKIHLKAGETINMSMFYTNAVNGNLDISFFHQDPNSGTYNLSNPDAYSWKTGSTPSEAVEEEFTFLVPTEGWYYLMVFGKTYADINKYVLQWEITASTAK